MHSSPAGQRDDGEAGPEEEENRTRLSALGDAAHLAAFAVGGSG